MPIEVLSPAGSREALTAALHAGADAVYFGTQRFNARRGAENFDRPGMEEAVADCRERGVRAYLALNILLSDGELPAAVAEAEAAARAGVDGVIVQDLGLAKALHATLPGLPLHASTQLSVHAPAALPLLRELGFTRVVAARELSRERLRTLCEAAQSYGISVEVFAHGALCMSLSGQCYFSAMLGGRSGNRGLCAGPCRLPMRTPGGTGYDLSLKDLSLLPHVAELQEMGVVSLKIEGRMKRPEYVAAATAALRSAVDTGTVPADVQEALDAVFSRTGFTDGYFADRRGRAMFGVRTKEDVRRTEPVLSSLRARYRKELPRVPVDAVLTLQPGTPARLTLTDGVHTACATGDCPQPAITRPSDPQSLRDACAKCGGTPYFLRDCRVEIADGLFFPAAACNALRREALDALREMRRRPPEKIEIRPLPTPPAVLRKSPPASARIARFADPAQLPEALSDVDAVCLPVECDFAALSVGNLPLLGHLPRGMLDEAPWRAHLERAKAQGVRAVFCGTLSAVSLCRAAGLIPLADFGLNLFNSAAVETVAALGVGAALLSFELPLRDANRIAPALPLGLFAYGRQPLMLTRNCPVANGVSCRDCRRDGAVTDRRRVAFPVRCRNGFSELLNANVLWLADRPADLAAFDFHLLSFTTESPAQVAEVLAAYASNGAPPQNYTRGLYDRGVK